MILIYFQGTVLYRNSSVVMIDVSPTWTRVLGITHAVMDPIVIHYMCRLVSFFMLEVSRAMHEKTCHWGSATRLDSNRCAQHQRLARALKFWI